MSNIRSWRHIIVGALFVLFLASSCGLPDGGSATRVEDDTVPYRLLETDPAPPEASNDAEVPGPEPVVFWLDSTDRLIPEATDLTCDAGPTAVVEQLLGELAAGPTDDARAAGRSTALPTESSLALVTVSEGTAEMEVDLETNVSPDRLPGAIGQVVLTATSAPGVDAVALLDDGAPIQVPLPGGALSEAPVTADDYASLVPDRYREVVGCP